MDCIEDGPTRLIKYCKECGTFCVGCRDVNVCGMCDVSMCDSCTEFNFLICCGTLACDGMRDSSTV